MEPLLRLLLLLLILPNNGQAASAELEGEEPANCTGVGIRCKFCKIASAGSLLIGDRAGEKHSFAGNVTTVQIDAVKDDMVLVEGKRFPLLTT